MEEAAPRDVGYETWKTPNLVLSVNGMSVWGHILMNLALWKSQYAAVSFIVQVSLPSLLSFGDKAAGNAIYTFPAKAVTTVVGVISK